MSTDPLDVRLRLQDDASAGLMSAHQTVTFGQAAGELAWHHADAMTAALASASETPAERVARLERELQAAREAVAEVVGPLPEPSGGRAIALGGLPPPPPEPETSGAHYRSVRMRRSNGSWGPWTPVPHRWAESVPDMGEYDAGAHGDAAHGDVAHGDSWDGHRMVVDTPHGDVAHDDSLGSRTRVSAVSLLRLPREGETVYWRRNERQVYGEMFVGIASGHSMIEAGRWRGAIMCRPMEPAVAERVLGEPLWQHAQGIWRCIGWAESYETSAQADEDIIRYSAVPPPATAGRDPNDHVW